MLSYLLAALESEEDKRRFIELYEENHVRAEQTALRILKIRMTPKMLCRMPFCR